MRTGRPQNDFIFSIMKKEGHVHVDTCGTIWLEKKDTRGRYTGVWSEKKNQSNGLRRRQFRYEGISFYASRLIWYWFNGPIPDDLEVDHKNNDKGDDRLENLQLLNRLHNQQKAESDGLITRGGPSPSRSDGVQRYWDTVSDDEYQARCKALSQAKTLNPSDSHKVWKTRHERYGLGMSKSAQNRRRRGVTRSHLE